jgi:hypothetical protein
MGAEEEGEEVKRSEKEVMTGDRDRSRVWCG